VCPGSKERQEVVALTGFLVDVGFVESHCIVEFFIDRVQVADGTCPTDFL
jgi:hypothetical protein